MGQWPTGRLAQVNHIMRLVFDAAANPQAWPAVINALADAMGASFASISFFDARTQTFATLAPRVDPADVRIYQEEWATMNELWRRSIAAPEGAILHPYAFVPRDEFIRSDYVLGYFAPRGMEAAVGTNVLVEDLASTMVHVNRSLQIGDFTETEVRLFAAVLPSIQRGVQLQRRLAAAEMETTTSASAFDRLSDGVVIVDAAFCIRFANRSAAEILADADGLRRAPDGIAAATTRETVLLRRFIAGWGSSDGLPPSGGRCQISRPAGRAPLSVVVVPVRTEAAWLSQRQPNAILFVTDPDRQRVMKADVVGRRFLLTQAEVRVVAEIAKGDGAEAVATRLGIGLATVRTHMHHIFEKTGTHRQAELVGLVMQSQTTLRED